MAMTSNPHDNFFRSSMQHASIAKQFFEQHLPAPLLNSLDTNAFELKDSTYIDVDLQETFSDLVFSCPYKQGVGKSSDAKVILLIEHQSTPDKLMPFRVFHYMFNMLYKVLKERNKKQAKDKLPAVHPLVFYHGKQTQYPLLLADCFDDPLNIMEDIFTKELQLVDVNKETDDELKKQQLLGIMTGALKHIRDRDIIYYLRWLADYIHSVDLHQPLTPDFFKMTFNYVLEAGNVKDVKQLIKVGRLFPKPVRGEFMTAAEKLRAWGEEEGLEKGLEQGLEQGLKKGLEQGREENSEEIAINALNEGADPRFVARIPGLDMSVILKLKTQLEDQHRDE
ncbi:MAG: Rpn family recombination-promoting nuclease/putative transposase [Algicola sp.]|nr:Rpn family recombination-promoting nuclease/putative transposase [Algicola sp.]